MKPVSFLLSIIFFVFWANISFAQKQVLKAESFKHYVDSFNANDDELYKQVYTNADAWNFLKQNIPLFDCPDKALEETYYFRWWTLRKHIKKTPSGYVFSEFLPAVDWAGKYNTISCAAGHHFYEARWLHNPEFLNSYMHFWLDSSGEGIRKYSFWAADAWKAFVSVHFEERKQPQILDKLITNYYGWEREHRQSGQQLFWQNDDADGMEVSVGGQINNNGVQAPNYPGIRPTINSYMYGDANAIAALEKEVGNNAIAVTFTTKADTIKRTMQQVLWSDSLQFFGSISIAKNAAVKTILPVRELIGFAPWYFNLPDNNNTYAAAWKQLMDTTGFMAPFGPTTCERRNPFFTIAYQNHECQWNGPSWPFATSQVLTAMANLLNNYTQENINRNDYYTVLSTYANSHRRITAGGKEVFWIDENLNPFTGDWISRTRLTNFNGHIWPDFKGGKERGKDYNHSTFNDLIISGLVGIRPSLNDSLTINPLAPKSWDYFCLDNVLYHGKILSVFYDKTGKRYNKGKGFFVVVNGKKAFAAATPQKAVIPIG